MKSRSAWVASLAVLAVLVGSVADTRASGGGAVASCQTANPAGAPIAMNISLVNVNPGTGTIDSVAVEAFFGKGAVGTFSASNVQFSNIGDAVQAACDIFNGTTLGSRIFAAIGLQATLMMFTACSVQGPGSLACKGPVGTINTPAGWNVSIVCLDSFCTTFNAGGVITGYAGRL